MRVSILWITLSAVHNPRKWDDRPLQKAGFRPWSKGFPRHYTNHSRVNHGPGIQTLSLYFPFYEKKHPTPSLRLITNLYEPRSEKEGKNTDGLMEQLYATTNRDGVPYGVGRMHMDLIVRVRVQSEKEKEKGPSGTTFRKVME